MQYYLTLYTFIYQHKLLTYTFFNINTLFNTLYIICMLTVFVTIQI